jgi:alpha-ketoglutarate-dependent taurine dioxygenase
MFAKPVTPAIGTEVSDIDLSAPLADDSTSMLRRLLVERKVLFFREQTDLDHLSQVTFASRFGPLTLGHPTRPSPEGAPLAFDIEGGRSDYWHTDVTFVDRPPMASVLRAVTVPEVGGDTLWVNTETAYQRLPAELARFADGLRVLHSNAYDYGKTHRVGLDEASRRSMAEFTSIVFETDHPLVRVHPESGERSLLLGGFARHVLGFPSPVSADLLRVFQSYVLRPEHQLRWRWRPGDVAMWDNRSTQHYAVKDYGDAYRHMQRVTVAGDRPVGVDGTPSRAVKGDAAFYTGANHRGDGDSSYPGREDDIAAGVPGHS